MSEKHFPLELLTAVAQPHGHERAALHLLPSIAPSFLAAGSRILARVAREADPSGNRVIGGRQLASFRRNGHREVIDSGAASWIRDRWRYSDTSNTIKSV